VNLSSLWDSLPPRIRDENRHSTSRTTESVLLQQSIRLEHVYTEFLLRALLREADERDHRQLILCAHEVLSIVLLPQRKRHLGESRRSDMEWTVSDKTHWTSVEGPKAQAYTQDVAARVLRHALCQRPSLGTVALGATSRAESCAQPQPHNTRY
jgi:hypothetical protein